MIGVIKIPSSITGDRVPDFLYYSQISSWINLLLYLKTKSACCPDVYARFGGDDMLNYLGGVSIPVIPYQPIVPSIEIPLLLRQNYGEVGVLSTYDENMDFDITLPENQGLSEIVVSDLNISAESKLTTLRSRKKVYNDDGSLADYILVNNRPHVPYEVGGDGVLSANTFNTYYLGDGVYVGDFVTKITYYDENGNTVSDPHNAAYVEFEYVLGGEFNGKEIIDYDNCEFWFLNLPDETTIIMPPTGGTVSFDLSASCDWSAYVVEGSDEFLTLKHTYTATQQTIEDVLVGNTYILTISGVSGFGSREEINVESNTGWRLIDIPIDDVTFSSDYGVDFRDIYANVKPYNSGGQTGIRTITAATVEYGSSYGNTKAIVIEQQLEYITINGQTVFY